MHEHSVDTTFTACTRAFDQAETLASVVLLDVEVFTVVEGVFDEDNVDDFDVDVVVDFDVDDDFVVVDDDVGAARLPIAIVHLTGYIDVQKACATA